jgi:short-subunit dehydrogenase
VPSSREFFRDKVVLITGASSGIGEGIALECAKLGAKITLAARRLDLLETLAQKITQAGGAQPLVVECDVTRDGDCERAVAETLRQFGKLDVAIANAGFGVVGEFRNLTIDDYRRQLETNLFGVLRTLYAALPEVEKTRGNLAIIGSVSGWGSTPMVSAYSMSKFALRSLADAITPELAPRGVKVTLISPGFIVSNIRRVDNQGAFHPGAKDSIPAWIQVSTERAARETLSAIAHGRREKIISMHGKLLVGLARFTPWVIRAANRHAVKKAQQKANSRRQENG